jgi:hypothetical protein
MISRGPRTHHDFLRERRCRRLARFALWVAGGLIVAGAVAALWP